MSSELLPNWSGNDNPATREIPGLDQPVTRLPRRYRRAVRQEAANGLVHATRVNAAAFVAEVGLTNLDSLTALEATIARRDPVSADRASQIVETYLIAVQAELRNMARRA